MRSPLEISRAIQKENFIMEFSICTLVTRKGEYSEMLQSFLDAGFSENICEFLFVDNVSGNNYDAFEAVNLFLHQSKGKYVIICHQDILIDKDNYKDLKLLLTKLDQIDPTWGVCGNAGAAGPNHIVYHISYPDGLFMSKGNLPLKVTALDENFLLIKNEAYLKVSNDIQGFHLYATDLVLQAELSGYSSYVIPFNLTHKSRGNRDASFYSIRKTLIQKYNHYFRPRWIQTNSTVFYLSGSLLRLLSGNAVFLFFVRMVNGIKKRAK
jgi:hypothetical protein